MLNKIRKHPVMATAFALATALTVFFAVRLVLGALFWPSAADAPIRGWMTVGYVAQTHSIPRDTLAEAIGITPGAYPRKSLARIAEDRGESVAAIIERLDAAIARRQEHDHD